MNWLENFVIGRIINRLEGYMAGYKTYVGAAIIYLGALLCFLQHVAAGDLSHSWQTCLAMVGGGTATVGLRAALGRAMDKLGTK